MPTVPERIVIDTNVFVSGLLSAGSTPARCIEAVVTRGQLVASHATLRELMRQLLSPKFDRYVARSRREELLVRLAPLVEIVDIVQQVRACRDQHDDQFLEVAVNGRADVIVTGDRDLLELDPFRGVANITPAEYLGR